MDSQLRRWHFVSHASVLCRSFRTTHAKKYPSLIQRRVCPAIFSERRLCIEFVRRAAIEAQRADQVNKRKSSSGRLELECFFRKNNRGRDFLAILRIPWRARQDTNHSEVFDRILLRYAYGQRDLGI